MNTYDENSDFSESSADEDFSFGYGSGYGSGCSYESDSEEEAENMVVEIDTSALDGMNEQFISDMENLNIEDCNTLEEEINIDVVHNNSSNETTTATQQPERNKPTTTDVESVSSNDDSSHEVTNTDVHNNSSNETTTATQQPERNKRTTIDVESESSNDDSSHEVTINIQKSTDTESISSEESANAKKERRGSLIKTIVEKKEAIFISLDLEHGGDKCGVTQLSAVLFQLGGFEESDSEKDVVISEEFNKYVRPPVDAIWNPICRETTGLHADHPSIKNADPINIVWNQFVSFLNKHIKNEQRAILVAWNGASCDLEWIYRLTQTPGATLSLPSRVKYFFDPYRGIKNTTGCKLNKQHSGLESYSLSSVYEKVTGEELENAHSSLVDARAQIRIVLSNEFRRIWKTKSSVQYISEMFTAKQKKGMDALCEPQREVHKSWSADDKAETWKPSTHYQYLSGSQGGTEAKPSTRIFEKATREKCTICDLFLEYVTVQDIFKPMSKYTQHYACEELVAPSNQMESSKKKKDILKPCKPSTGPWDCIDGIWNSF